MKLFNVAALVFALSTVACGTASYAMDVSGDERPVQIANEMEIVSATGRFEIAQSVSLTLNTRQGSENPTSIDLRWIAEDNNKRSILLVIVDVDTLEDGSIQYTAQYRVDPAQALQSPRWSVVLVAKTGEGFGAEITWEAHVRQGYGWCGTGDSTMFLRGTPEFVYHTM